MRIDVGGQEGREESECLDTSMHRGSRWLSLRRTRKRVSEQHGDESDTLRDFQTSGNIQSLRETRQRGESFTECLIE